MYRYLLSQMSCTITLIKSITRSSRSTSVPPTFKRQGKYLHFSSQHLSRIKWQVCHPHQTPRFIHPHLLPHRHTSAASSSERPPRRQARFCSPSTLIVVRSFIVILILELYAVPNDFHMHAGHLFDSSKMFHARIHGFNPGSMLRIGFNFSTIESSCFFAMMVRLLSCHAMLS